MQVCAKRTHSLPRRRSYIRHNQSQPLMGVSTTNYNAHLWRPVNPDITVDRPRLYLLVYCLRYRRRYSRILRLHYRRLRRLHPAVHLQLPTFSCISLSTSRITRSVLIKASTQRRALSSDTTLVSRALSVASVQGTGTLISGTTSIFSALVRAGLGIYSAVENLILIYSEPELNASHCHSPLDISGEG